MTLPRGGHQKPIRNGLIFGKLPQFFFLVFFKCCADSRSLNNAIPRRTPKSEP
ncbi:uncharacterized protein DS421_18g622470 [Arachis hypogaea]|nr:uncharacterized protein DS421_18g622470 [Arachis hypogaea]